MGARVIRSKPNLFDRASESCLGVKSSTDRFSEHTRDFSKARAGFAEGSRKGNPSLGNNGPARALVEPHLSSACLECFLPANRGHKFPQATFHNVQKQRESAEALIHRKLLMEGTLYTTEASRKVLQYVKGSPGAGNQRPCYTGPGPCGSLDP